MRSVGIKRLKRELSRHVRLAAAGETVLIVDQDKVVAQITAPNTWRGPLLADALLADAVGHGWIAPPQFAGTAAPTSKPVAPLSELLDELDDDRGAR